MYFDISRHNNLIKNIKGNIGNKTDLEEASLQGDNNNAPGVKKN